MSESQNLEIELRLVRTDELEVLQSIDDDASGVYPAHGIVLDLDRGHPFCQAERARWSRAAELGRAFLALDAAARGVGFATLDRIDGAPYLDQLSVRQSAMRRGIGRALLCRAAEWARAAGGSALWLTTYGHLPFNRPYYERHGYELVPEAACGPELRHHLAEQRRHLPDPEQRVAMRRRL